MENTLWKRFEELCKVPRPSGYMDAVRRYILDWAEDNGFRAFSDEAGSVIVKVPATAGREACRSMTLLNSVRTSGAYRTQATRRFLQRWQGISR